MAKLKRDERVCPFCAETIKASAIKCRFCQSDVTPVIEPDVEAVVAPPAQKTPAAKKVPAKKTSAVTKAPAKAAPVAKVAERTMPVGDDLPAKSSIIAGFLGIFLGGLGLHRFYLGFWRFGLMFFAVPVAVVAIGTVLLISNESWVGGPLALVGVLLIGLSGLWGFIEGVCYLAGVSNFRHDAWGRSMHDSTPDRAFRAVKTPNLTLVLAVLVAFAAAGVGGHLWRAEQGPSDVAPNGVLVGDDARTEVLIAGADLATRTLSYDYKTFENDMETARARMTKSFAKEYDATMTQVKANTEKNKIVLQATAVSSAIISATEHKAKVLVFLNQTTTAGVGKAAKQQANQNSLVITLTRGDGDWAISKLAALG